MNIVLDILSYILVVTGIIFCAIGVLGLLRLPDLITKQHALGLIDTLGAFCICAALAIHSGLSIVSIKIILLAILLGSLSAPTTTMLTKVALISNIIKKHSNKNNKNVNS